MTLDYFYGQAGELFSFYRIPKALFQEPRFQSLSTDAKTLYGILLDRMSLSVKNGWLDEQNRVFIIFTIEDVKRALCCADNKATKLLRELEKFGLIERKRRGLGKPSLVYVKNFSAESSKSIFQNRDFHDSGGFKNASQDPSKSRCNKTKENDTEMSETDPFYSEEADGMSKRTQLEEYFSQSLEIDLLLRLCPDDEDIIYQIVDLLVDTCATNRKLLHIAGDDKPAEVVYPCRRLLYPGFEAAEGTPPYWKVRTDAQGIFKGSPPSQIEHIDLDRGVMDIPCRPERTGTGTVRHHHGADERYERKNGRTGRGLDKIGGLHRT